MLHKKILELKETKNGTGVFAKTNISADQMICEFKGDFFNSDTLNKSNPYYLQIGKNLFLGPSGDYDDYINHSCSPNCKIRVVGKRAFLYSMKPISAGTEITFDYSTTSNEDDGVFAMKCNCGNFNCRKIIKGYQYLSEDIRSNYLKLDAIPPYLK